MSQVALGRVLTVANNAVELQPDETYRIAGIYSFGKGLFEREVIRGAETSYRTLTRLHEGQFVLSKLNGWEGAVDVVDLDIAGCHVSSEFPVFDIDREHADPDYLRWITRWPAFWDLLMPRGSMVRRKRVQVNQLLEVELPLPPINRQRRVAAHLDRVGAMTRHVANRAAHFDEVATALRASLLAGEHYAGQWHDTELASVLRLDEHKVAVAADATYPIVGVYSFGRGIFERGEIAGSSTSYKSLNRIAAGQIVMSRLKAWEGGLAAVPDALDGRYVSPEFPTFTADETSADRRFLAALVTTRAFWSQLGGGSRGIGARRERVHAERLLEQRIALPPLDVQSRVADHLARIEVVHTRRSALADQLAAIPVSLLNREFGSLPA
jgi:type I restriction enzyme S subunit